MSETETDNQAKNRVMRAIAQVSQNERGARVTSEHLQRTGAMVEGRKTEIQSYQSGMSPSGKTTFSKTDVALALLENEKSTARREYSTARGTEIGAEFHAERVELARIEQLRQSSDPSIQKAAAMAAQRVADRETRRDPTLSRYTGAELASALDSATAKDKTATKEASILASSSSERDANRQTGVAIENEMRARLRVGNDPMKEIRTTESHKVGGDLAKGLNQRHVVKEQSKELEMS